MGGETRELRGKQRAEDAELGSQAEEALVEEVRGKQALAAALPTLAEDDCSIELVVSSVDKSGKEGRRIGAATVALKPLLQAGADRTSAPLALVDAAGAEVGQLTCAVTALAASRRRGTSRPSSTWPRSISSSRRGPASGRSAVSTDCARSWNE